mmetsp:Transcript_52125/g.124157  ORF Transcript_52125/g.124157 Transcript_52125/m.124157 type:complete len:257 (+) Transcript_52125:200-970(+)
MASSDGGQSEVQGLETLLEQNFASLEQAIESGDWEVDGDDVELRVTNGEDNEGPSGALLSASGRSDARAELCHWLNGGDGSQVHQLRVKFIIEELDVRSCGSFTVGLAFDEDFEEEAILAITLRHTRIDPTDGEVEAGGCEGEVFSFADSMEMLLNGRLLTKDVVGLPLRVELNCRLRWDEDRTRKVGVHYRLLQGGPDVSAQVVADGTGEADFYTPRKHCKVAKALSLRAAGTTSVRLITARMAGKSSPGLHSMD